MDHPPAHPSPPTFFSKEHNDYYYVDPITGESKWVTKTFSLPYKLRRKLIVANSVQGYNADATPARYRVKIPELKGEKVVDIHLTSFIIPDTWYTVDSSNNTLLQDGEQIVIPSRNYTQEQLTHTLTSLLGINVSYSTTLNKLVFHASSSPFTLTFPSGENSAHKLLGFHQAKEYSITDTVAPMCSNMRTHRLLNIELENVDCEDFVVDSKNGMPFSVDYKPRFRLPYIFRGSELRVRITDAETKQLVQFNGVHNTLCFDITVIRWEVDTKYL